jgi:hypothetical protein
MSGPRVGHWARIPDDPRERQRLVDTCIDDSLATLRDQLREALLVDGKLSPEGIDRALDIAETKARPILEDLAAAAHRRGVH